MKLRVGIGYDSHKFAFDRKLVIGGIEIENDRGLLGHSDADVLLHAIIDAMLGAAGLRDIGYYFPNTAEYKNISSLKLLEKAKRILENSGYTVNNVDSTIIIEKPRLSSYIPHMKKKISQILQISEKEISIKAKTNEGMGFVGREEGIAAIAVVTIKEND
ncbi:MAG TPA: 2-C-methyl-D-erythritol 2,4-cyclodiphosphate synthase [Thermotogaceae bacterium]|nr:2-C-methyl-D-erythritol 2,4-cyclodiphosphate synthase [Thermotogaceae bacterium]